VKTTVDLPDDILERTKIAAVRRRTSLKNLIIEGLEAVLREEIPAEPSANALTRLRQGYHLGGQPLTRDQTLQVRWQLSLWDAMILAAAQASGARELLTEDLNHGQNYGGIRVVNPFK
jgi:predicted nucleic acid-binding protein